MSPPLLPTLILSSFLSFILSVPSGTLAARAPPSRTCYSPDGTVLDPSIYAPCRHSSQQHSMCCPISDKRKGQSKGNRNSIAATWRGGCTDPKWESPFCVKLCTHGGADGRLTKCASGTWCCGAPTSTTAHKCCEEGKGFQYDPNTFNENYLYKQNGNAILVRRAGPVETPASSSGSEIPTAPPTDNGERALSTAAVAGVAVGAAGAMGLLITGLFLYLHRKRKQPDAPKVPVFPYDMSGTDFQSKDSYGGRRNDGIFEMSTRGPPPPPPPPRNSNKAKRKEERIGENNKRSSGNIDQNRDEDEIKSVPAGRNDGYR